MSNVEESIVIKYGVVTEYDNFTLWFEPVTDIKDGFVLRENKEPYGIVEIYLESFNANKPVDQI